MNEIRGNELRELIPAMDFKDDVAYTVFPMRMVEENKVIEKLMVVTSERKCYPLTPENLFPLGFYAKRTPFLVNRWSENDIQVFLKGKKTVEPHSVFAQVKEQFKTYIDFPDPGYYSLLALWVIGTYFHRIFSSYPYVHLRGQISTGKTKTLTLAALLSFNGELMFNSSHPFIIRMVHGSHATLCIDEAEALRGRNSILVSLLNGGYKKGVYVGKMEKENGIFTPCLFESYSCKIFGSINGLSKSLGSRCIRVNMMETSKSEIKNREVDIEKIIFQDIRDSLYTLMLTQFPKIRECYSTLTDEEIQGRAWELFKPILALAKMFENRGTGVYDNVRRLAISQIKERSEEKREDMTSRFLVRLKEIVDAYPLKTNFYPVAYLLQSFKKKPGFETIEGKFIANQLKNFNLTPNGSTLKKLSGKATRGYYLDRKAVAERSKVVGNG